MKAWNTIYGKLRYCTLIYISPFHISIYQSLVMTEGRNWERNYWPTQYQKIRIDRCRAYGEIQIQRWSILTESTSNPNLAPIDYSLAFISSSKGSFCVVHLLCVWLWSIQFLKNASGAFFILFGPLQSRCLSLPFQNWHSFSLRLCSKLCCYSLSLSSTSTTIHL